jgi:hypothetical protein
MWNVPQTLDNLFARIKSDERLEAEETQHRLLQQPSRGDVLHAFRLILGREPEDRGAIDAHMLIPPVAELRRVLRESQLLPDLTGDKSRAPQRSAVRTSGESRGPFQGLNVQLFAIRDHQR